ncbi:MAG: hypothetical protein QOG64_1151 [Acidimicrobiaceae bacterium]|nr:hypothetical protein [Acidimicrobiaceae bacterium]
MAEVLWESGHLSSVVALRLTDDRQVVVKARPWTPSLAGCHAVHAHVWTAGFPCPEPLIGPVSLGQLAATAEAHLPGGQPGVAEDATLAERSAAALAALIACAPPVASVPSLDPPRPWAGWADPRATPWPPPDEGIALNDLDATEDLRRLASTLNQRLRASSLAPVIGHVDWYQGNLRWDGDRLVAADDWDSAAALPEAALAGCAAVSFRPERPGIDPPGWPGAEIEDSNTFLTAYAAARSHPFDREEIEGAWAAGLWQRTFDAAKALADGRPQAAADQLRDAAARLLLAGL